MITSFEARAVLLDAADLILLDPGAYRVPDPNITCKQLRDVADLVAADPSILDPDVDRAAREIYAHRAVLSGIRFAQTVRDGAQL